MDMKYRLTSGSVTVTGPPARICSRNNGTTLPAESSTLPNRTVTKRVSNRVARHWHTNSAQRLLAPSTLAGLTALSVEISTKVPRSEEHTSELQSLMRISYAVLCMKKNNHTHED